MRVLITGGTGMLGRTLARHLSAAGHVVDARGRSALDVTDAAACADAVVGADLVVHCAAFTRVDDCEGDEAVAHAVNADGAGTVAAACADAGARLIAISTDYVFAGDAGPYAEGDAPAPATAYGRSKLAGEAAIAAVCPTATLLRVAWLYGQGGPSFWHTMRRLLADDEAPPLRVVDDQRGCPTSCDAVAAVVADLAADPLPGPVHAACGGETTWYGFTRAIAQRLGSRRGIEPCTSAEYPRPAPRPADSRLEPVALRAAGRPLPWFWDDALDRFHREYPDG